MSLFALAFALFFPFLNGQVKQEMSIHLVGTTNVNGETDPCG